MSNDEFVARFNEIQESVMLARRIQLAIGCVILSVIITSIIRKKLFVYNTTKLFMWFCICYLIGMLVVLLHYERMSAGFLFSYDSDLDKADPNYILNVLNQMKKDGTSLYLCGVEAFINLYAYDFGYFFAVLVSYNVLSVINGNYRNFMKNIFKRVRVIVFLIAMFIVYATPLLLMLIQDDFLSGSYAYSYGPMGFSFQTTINGVSKTANLLLFAGFVSKPDSALFNALSLVNVFVCPVFMVIVHGAVLFLNRRKMKQFSDEQYLNSKQRFLIKSGKLGLIVFSIQFLHFFKSILVLMIGDQYVIIICINFLFDCYPLFLLIYYTKYTKQKSYQQKSSTITEDFLD